jgi:hypothetical protein
MFILQKVERLRLKAQRKRRAARAGDDEDESHGVSDDSELAKRDANDRAEEGVVD